MTKSRLRNSWILAYSAPMVPMGALHTPALSILPGVYAKFAGIELATLGTILIVSRLFDVFTDPLIGYLSDRSDTRIGPRKPWILGGAIMVMIATWFWFRPGSDTGVAYFLIWSLVVYLGWTLVEIPHAAWLSELNTDYRERSRLASFRAMGNYGGHILFFCVPFLPFFATTEFTPEVTAFSSWIIILLLGISVVAMLYVLPSRTYRPTHQSSSKEIIAALYGNKPFLIFIFSVVSSGLAGGMTAGLYFFFMNSYLGIGDKIAHVGLAAFVVSLCATQLWPPLIRRVGKHRTLAISSFGTICALGVMGFVRPGDTAYPMMLAVFVMSAITSSGSPVCALAMMADIVDYDEWKTGNNKAASYFAFSSIVGKAGIAVGGGLALVIVGLFGFDVAGGNDRLAMTGFYAAFLGIPIVLYIVSIILVLNFPIDERRHGIVRRRLDSLAQRKKMTKHPVLEELALNE